MRLSLCVALCIGLTSCIHETRPVPVSRTVVLNMRIPKAAKGTCPDPAQAYKQAYPVLPEGCH
jgi:hypothetical protein